MSTRQNTKEALISAAERLFAEKGFGAVSVKDITQLAGAKNPSAVHYHFGSLEGLQNEVFAQRYQQIDEAQVERIAAVDEIDPEVRLVAILEAAMKPFLEACFDEGGRLYIRFCYQLSTNPRFNAPKLMTGVGLQSVGRLRETLHACLRHIPAERLHLRSQQCFFISIKQAADYAAQVEAGTALPLDEAVHEAALCQAGYLSAQ